MLNSNNCNHFPFCKKMINICTIGPTCCAEKKEVRRKKKYSNSKVKEENIAVVYYSALIAATRKVPFSCVLLLPSSRWWRGVGESWLFDTRLTDGSSQTVVGHVGTSEPLTHPFWQLPSTLPKSRYLFSYIEILENKSKILECSMSPVKHMIMHLWLF